MMWLWVSSLQAKNPIGVNLCFSEVFCYLYAYVRKGLRWHCYVNWSVIHCQCYNISPTSILFKVQVQAKELRILLLYLFHAINATLY